VSEFEEFQHALPRTAVFTVADGRRFLMEIASIDDSGNVQLAAIEGQPMMRSEDFDALQTLTYLDEMGRCCKRMTRDTQPQG
jgi:hypothetical protein